jgi:hypothetical protein
MCSRSEDEDADTLQTIISTCYAICAEYEPSLRLFISELCVEPLLEIWNKGAPADYNGRQLSLIYPGRVDRRLRLDDNLFDVSERLSALLYERIVSNIFLEDGSADPSFFLPMLSKLTFAINFSGNGIEEKLILLGERLENSNIDDISVIESCLQCITNVLNFSDRDRTSVELKEWVKSLDKNIRIQSFVDYLTSKRVFELFRVRELFFVYGLLRASAECDICTNFYIDIRCLLLLLDIFYLSVLELQLLE